jgi:hypothetical protein
MGPFSRGVPPLVLLLLLLCCAPALGGLKDHKVGCSQQQH